MFHTKGMSRIAGAGPTEDSAYDETNKLVMSQLKLEYCVPFRADPERRGSSKGGVRTFKLPSLGSDKLQYLIPAALLVVNRTSSKMDMAN